MGGAGWQSRTKCRLNITCVLPTRVPRRPIFVKFLSYDFLSKLKKLYIGVHQTKTKIALQQIARAYRCY